jgi:hypothetical protein
MMTVHDVIEECAKAILKLKDLHNNTFILTPRATKERQAYTDGAIAATRLIEERVHFPQDAKVCREVRKIYESAE